MTADLGAKWPVPPYIRTSRMRPRLIAACAAAAGFLVYGWGVMSLADAAAKPRVFLDTILERGDHAVGLFAPGSDRCLGFFRATLTPAETPTEETSVVLSGSFLLKGKAPVQQSNDKAGQASAIVKGAFVSRFDGLRKLTHFTGVASIEGSTFNIALEGDRARYLTIDTASEGDRAGTRWKFAVPPMFLRRRAEGAFKVASEKNLLAALDSLSAIEGGGRTMARTLDEPSRVRCEHDIASQATSQDAESLDLTHFVSALTELGEGRPR